LYASERSAEGSREQKKKEKKKRRKKEKRKKEKDLGKYNRKI
jgi:hypothetical protein